MNDNSGNDAVSNLSYKEISIVAKLKLVMLGFGGFFQRICAGKIREGVFYLLCVVTSVIASSLAGCRNTKSTFEKCFWLLLMGWSLTCAAPLTLFALVVKAKTDAEFDIFAASLSGFQLNTLALKKVETGLKLWPDSLLLARRWIMVAPVNHDEYLKRLEELEESAMQITESDPRLFVRLCGSLSNARLNLGKQDEADVWAELALEFSERLGDIDQLEKARAFV